MDRKPADTKLLIQPNVKNRKNTHDRHFIMAIMRRVSSRSPDTVLTPLGIFRVNYLKSNLFIDSYRREDFETMSTPGMFATSPLTRGDAVLSDTSFSNRCKRVDVMPPGSDAQ